MLVRGRAKELGFFLFLFWGLLADIIAGIWSFNVSNYWVGYMYGRIMAAVA